MSNDQRLRQILANEHTRWEWIKYQLNLRGSSIAQVARSIPARPTYLHKLKKLQCPRYEIRLAQALDLTPQVLFPDRYNEHGIPKRGQLPANAANSNKLPKRSASRNMQAAGAE